MAEKLIPPDETRCQAINITGSFLSFGRPTRSRCEVEPVVIVTENKPQETDGQRGSMSLCSFHLEKFLEQFGKKYATVTKIRRKSCG